MATQTADNIHAIWDWCRDSYLRIAGRRISLPAGTDPTKTYQWRYMEVLAQKFEEWEFDDPLRKEFIDAAVRYAKERKLLSKGLAIFLQKNLLQECYRSLKERANKDDDALAILRRTKAWLDNQLALAQEHGTCEDLAELLTTRDGIGAYPNIIRWFQGGQLPEVYLAISRSCGIALARLSRQRSEERALLPTDARLFLTRTSVLREARVKFEVRNILSDDWRKPCPL